MNIKQLVSHACSLSALLAVTACNNSTPTGSLEVAFEIGTGLVQCDSLNVKDVTVSLLEPLRPDVEPVSVADVTVDCAAGKALFTNVEVGKYNVRIEGRDADRTVVIDNGLTLETDIGEVLEGQDTTLGRNIKLYPTPAELQLRWTFEGFVTQCTQIPLANFEVIAYKNKGSTPIAMGAFACDSVPDADTYHTLLDPDRDLEGAELDAIEITPRDETGNSVGAKIVFNLVGPPGPGKTVKLTFSTECTADKCDLKCKDDVCLPD
jgi:hypothetical protein